MFRLVLVKEKLLNIVFRAVALRHSFEKKKETKYFENLQFMALLLFYLSAAPISTYDESLLDEGNKLT